MLMNYPADMHNVGSPAMELRGTVTRRCFATFATILWQNSIHYQNTVGSKTTEGAVHALGTWRSNRLPPGQHIFSLQLKQAGTVYALDHGDTDCEDDGNDLPDLEGPDFPGTRHNEDPHLAAFPATGTRQAIAAAPRDYGTGGSRQPGGRRDT